jgi:Flp pilus assembly protein TadB
VDGGVVGQARQFLKRYSKERNSATERERDELERRLEQIQRKEQTRSRISKLVRSRRRRRREETKPNSGRKKKQRGLLFVVCLGFFLFLFFFNICSSCSLVTFVPKECGRYHYGDSRVRRDVGVTGRDDDDQYQQQQ